jgi:hypothetical protein
MSANVGIDIDVDQLSSARTARYCSNHGALSSWGSLSVVWILQHVNAAVRGLQSGGPADLVDVYER